MLKVLHAVRARIAVEHPGVGKAAAFIAEFERSKGGRWRRLLPSSRSAEYEQFIGGERLVRNKYPFAFQ